jgi:hypothetical protein
LCRICGSQSPRAMSPPLLDMSQCAGASACRFCAVIGALTFDEPFPSWPLMPPQPTPATSQPSTPARRFSSQQVGPPLLQQPAPVPAPATAASASAGSSGDTSQVLQQPAQKRQKTPPDGNDGQEALAKSNGAGESFIGPLQQAWHPASPAVFVPVDVIPDSHKDKLSDPVFRVAHRKIISPPPSAASVQCYRLKLQDDAGPYIERREIDFRFWSDVDFAKLWMVICTVSGQPFVRKVYLGTTQLAAWRWHRCDGHNNMVPHSRHYDKMFPLGACWGINVLAFEQLLQGLMLKHFTPKCSFDDRWRPGPLCRKGQAMLYLCVEVYPGYKGSF